MPKLLLAVALLLCLPMVGYAQLAQSFYSITNIKTDVLPNAIRITVETDGNVEMGVEVYDFLDLGTNNDRFSLLPLRRFRLRFIGAKAKIPADRGYVVNLGHGILPHTPVEHARLFVEEGKR